LPQIVVLVPQGLLARDSPYRGGSSGFVVLDLNLGRSSHCPWAGLIVVFELLLRFVKIDVHVSHGASLGSELSLESIHVVHSNALLVLTATYMRGATHWLFTRGT